MSTIIVDLYGGPGTGKSTTAALLFARLKQAGLNAELVREYVKEWAWEGRTPGPFDQFYFFGKQSRKESLLYGRVDVIVTDSPVMLAAFYATKFMPPSTAKGIAEIAKSFYMAALLEGYMHLPVFLKRTKDYNPAGRFQTEAEAKAIDGEMLDFLVSTNVDALHYGTTDEEVDRLTLYIQKILSHGDNNAAK